MYPLKVNLHVWRLCPYLVHLEHFFFLMTSPRDRILLVLGLPAGFFGEGGSTCIPFNSSSNSHVDRFPSGYTVAT